jgi:hypothetical protein
MLDLQFGFPAWHSRHAGQQSDGSGAVLGAVIHDDDLLVRPCLRKGGLDGVSDPNLGVVGIRIETRGFIDSDSSGSNNR